MKGGDIYSSFCRYENAIVKFFFDSFRKGSKRGNKGNIFKRFLVSLAKMTEKTKK